jgi:N-acetylglucosaminyl-diphospho-decaprenol L-rhamnosyltransferase
MDDLAIITVSTNEAHWIRRLLPTLFAHLGDIRCDVVVVNNESHDDIGEMIATEFPTARTVWSANHGFGHANNRGLMTCNARYVLFLNPDTEILDGTFEEMVRLMDERPTVGLIGCRQMTPEGRLDTTIRYFPNAARAAGEALSAERLPWRRPRWLGEREIDPDAYERESTCDWITGSFMMARREALESAGYFDERFFMYSDETDLCRRIKTAGWEVRHLPQMTIFHHDRKAGIKPHIEILGAVTRIQYGRKYFSPGHRVLYAAAVALRHLMRAIYSGSGESGRQKRAANREVVATLLGRHPVPFASITNRVSVEVAAPELRDTQVRRRGLPEADSRPSGMHTAA